MSKPDKCSSCGCAKLVLIDSAGRSGSENAALSYVSKQGGVGFLGLLAFKAAEALLNYAFGKKTGYRWRCDRCRKTYDFTGL